MSEKLARILMSIKSLSDEEVGALPAEHADDAAGRRSAATEGPR